MEKKIITAVAALTLGASYGMAQEIATWSGDRKGAASFTFDDGPQSDVDFVLPAFDKYGYKATFNIVVDWANGGSNGMLNWSGVQKLADSGHEIASHSNSHGQNMSGEESSSKSTISGKIKQDYGVLTVAYPNCNVPNSSAVTQNYIAGRICGNGQEVMGKDGPGDWVRVPALMTGSTGQYNNANAFTGAMQQAVNKGGWVMFLSHGFDGASNGYANYSPTSKDAITGALSWANQNDKDIWITSFRSAVMYIKERNKSKVNKKSGDANSITFEVTHSIADNISKYDYPLTIKVKNDNNWTKVKATQGGAEVEAKIANGNILVEAVPNAGDVVVSNADASTPASSSSTPTSSSAVVPPQSSASTPASSSSENPFNPFNPFNPGSSSTTALPTQQFDASNVAVFNENGYITVRDAQGLSITVFNTLGHKVRETRGLGCEQKVYTGAKGVYIVRVGNRTFKTSL